MIVTGCLEDIRFEDAPGSVEVDPDDTTGHAQDDESGTDGGQATRDDPSRSSGMATDGSDEAISAHDSIRPEMSAGEGESDTESDDTGESDDGGEASSGDASETDETGATGETGETGEPGRNNGGSENSIMDRGRGRQGSRGVMRDA